MPDRGSPNSEDEAERLRAAYERRGRPELRLADNPGQRKLVAERDRRLRETLSKTPHSINDLLEIGCGEGSVVAALCAAGVARRGVGIDLLAEAIAEAVRLHPGLEFHVGDAAHLAFEDRHFDAVLATTVLSSVPTGQRREAILREVDRVLRPGGIFCWYDMRVRSPSNPDVRPLTPAEIGRALPGYVLGWRSLTVAPPIARRLGRLTNVAYPLLAALPMLRTHTIGTATKP